MKKYINPQANAIQARFFQALELAIQSGKISGLKGFCRDHNFNRTKYSLLRNTLGTDAMTYRVIDLDALSAICKDCGVNPAWLLLGVGDMLSNKDSLKCTSKKE